MEISGVLPSTSPQDFYSSESARIHEAFDRTGDGDLAVRQRSALADRVIEQEWLRLFSDEIDGPGGFAALAVGGYGRGALLPHSDIDILFLAGDKNIEAKFPDKVREFCREMWDAHVRVSPVTRALPECDRLDQNSLDFTTSLLDCRHIAGDPRLIERLRDEVLLKLVNREWQTLVQGLSEQTRIRHAKHGNTVFHLEPNVKDCPGGLRDYNVARLLSQLACFDQHRFEPGLRWPSPNDIGEIQSNEELKAAQEFFLTLRCYLHYRHGRDHNQLSWELQNELAASGTAGLNRGCNSAAEWMRLYFRHARSVFHWTTQSMREVPGRRSALYRQFQNWRSRLSNADFSVSNGSIFLRQPSALRQPEMLLGTFEFMAHHGLNLAADTERSIRECLPAFSREIAARLPNPGTGTMAMAAATLEIPATKDREGPPAAISAHRAGEAVCAVAEFLPEPAVETPKETRTGSWAYLRQILIAPHAAEALRAMHRLGALQALIPEYQLIDGLVVRDLYHHYTVDEHSFTAIESLHLLRHPKSADELRNSGLLNELEEPELLFLALLLHDLGKGMPVEDPVEASIKIAEQILSRNGVADERHTVRFLIANHLEMSGTLRRDIFDHETVAAFAAKAGTHERLKMLCLFTYADIAAVNPEAMPEWKADNLWQLYQATANYLNRSVEGDRFQAAFEAESRASLHALFPGDRIEVDKFLAGLPQRYLRIYTAEQILRHLAMASQLQQQSVQLAFKANGDLHELTLVTSDRPYLFATIAGVLFAWGMDVVRANAFSNHSGLVVDNFLFKDRLGLLALNPSERERFRRRILQILSGEMSLEQLIQSRKKAPAKSGAAKVEVKTRIEFDNESSSRCTLLEVIAQDRAGLLHSIAATLAENACNIEAALIDTEGHSTTDVFYLTSRGGKLTDHRRQLVRERLLARLAQ